MLPRCVQLLCARISSQGSVFLTSPATVMFSLGHQAAQLGSSLRRPQLALDRVTRNLTTTAISREHATLCQARLCNNQGLGSSRVATVGMLSQMGNHLHRSSRIVQEPSLRCITHFSTKALGGEAAAATAATAVAGDSMMPGNSSTDKPSTSSTSSNEVANGNLALMCGAFVLPHPDKIAKGGEDWYYVSETMRSIGVADGVGGWADVNVDAGAYARQLMGHAKDAADECTLPGSPTYEKTKESLTHRSNSNGSLVNVSSDSKALPLQQAILEKAYLATDARGSSTACVLVLVANHVLASNLGDSGFLIIRDGQTAFSTPQQQHAFNFPYQIGAVDSMSDPPTAAQRFELVVQPGDMIVMGTDGLWDNCFNVEICSVINYCQSVSMPLSKAAQVLAHYARHRASDPKYASPFAFSAVQAKVPYMGGKMDDITVVLAKVVPADEVPHNYKAGSGGSDYTMPGSKPASKL